MISKFGTSIDFFSGSEPVNSLWLLPQKLSLDAVFISLAWQIMFAPNEGVSCPWSVLLAGSGAVWMIYTLDHLLDLNSPRWASDTARHAFVHRYSRELSVAFAFVFTGTLCSTFELPRKILHAGLAMWVLVMSYIVITHLAGERIRRFWPKEMVIAALFAGGSTIATWSQINGKMKLFFPFALLIGLFWMNCAGLDFWQWEVTKKPVPLPHAWTLWVGHNFKLASSILIAATLICLRDEVLYLFPSRFLAVRSSYLV